MDIPEGKKIAEFAEAVRQSTLKRLRKTPEGYENWSPYPDVRSFSQIAQHLIDADKWLFRMLDRAGLKEIIDRVGHIEVDEYEDYLNLLAELEATGETKIKFLEKMDESRLVKLIFDPKFGKGATGWWMIMRGNIDHEIHHRGQVAVFLRLLNHAILDMTGVDPEIVKIDMER